MGALADTLRKTYPSAIWRDAGRNDAALGIVGDEYVFVCAADVEYMAEDSRGVQSFGRTPEHAVSSLSVFSGIARRCYGCENVAMADSEPEPIVPAGHVARRPN